MIGQTKLLTMRSSERVVHEVHVKTPWMWCGLRTRRRVRSGIRADGQISSDVHGDFSCRWISRHPAMPSLDNARSGCDLGLSGTTARTLAGDHDSGDEQLSTPDTAGLATLLGSGEAFLDDRAALAPLLSQFHVRGRLREPQFRVGPARG